MSLSKEKVERFLSDYQKKDYKKLGKDLLFHPAICHLQLGNYKEAKRLFKVSFQAMLKPPHMWKLGGAPELLVNVFMISGSRQYARDVRLHLEEYKRNPPGNPSAAFAYIALYAYSVMEMLLPSGDPIQKYIEGLLTKPKIKDGYAMGKILKAITERDQTVFNESMTDLLKAHEGIAKYGGLRESAEGFLCMPAMTFAHIALQNTMKVELKNDYLSIKYLNFLYLQEEIGTDL